MIDFIKNYFKCTWPERLIWTVMLLIAGLVLFGSYNCVSQIYDALHVEYTCTEHTVMYEGNPLTIASVTAPDRVERYLKNCEDAMTQFNWYNTPWHICGVSGILSGVAFSTLIAVLLIVIFSLIMSYVNIIQDAIDNRFLARSYRCTNSMFRRCWLNLVGDVQFLVLGHSKVTEKDIGIDRVWMR